VFFIYLSCRRIHTVVFIELFTADHTSKLRPFNIRRAMANGRARGLCWIEQCAIFISSPSNHSFWVRINTHVVV